MENWKQVVGFEGLYEVSDMGRIRSLPQRKIIWRNGCPVNMRYQGKILRQNRTRNGYLLVWLYGGERKVKGRNGGAFSVHQIVARAFCDNPHGYTEVNHINEDKQDNRATNLEWCDRKHNMNHGTVQARRVERVSYKVDRFDLKGNYIDSFPSMCEAARQTGVTYSSINNCLTGKYRQAKGYIWKRSAS